MDMNLFRSISTVLGLLCFALLTVWAFSKAAKPTFDEAAQRLIQDDDLPKSRDQ